MNNNKINPRSEFKKSLLLESAIIICFDAHKDQKRKGDEKPYYIHPVMVAMKLAKHGFPEEVLAAALTHDVLEETDMPKEILSKKLGNKVADIVETLTQDDSLKWEEKKLKYIENVKNGSFEAKMVSVADKIHNLESFLIAYEEQGEKLWSKFNAPKEKKIWFEEELLKALSDVKHPLMDEYRALHKQLKIKS